jgi:hypothetical protein
VGLREVLNENPRASAGVGVTLFAAAVGWVVWSLATGGGEGAASQAAVQPKAWFSTDDGATWFADDEAKPSPFQTADGKTAVKVVVFKCGHGKTFAAYLERRTPAAQLAAVATKDSKNPYANQMAGQLYGTQVKPPKTGAWVLMNDPAAVKIVTPVCPEGSQDHIDLVVP